MYLFIKFLKNKQNKETFWAMVAKMIFVVSGLFFIIFIPKFSGIANYGSFSLVLSYIYLLQMFFGSIFMSGVKKEITEHKFDQHSLKHLLTVFLLTFFSYVVSSFLFLLLLNFLEIEILRENRIYFIFLMLFNLTWNICTHFFEYTHRLFYFALIYLLEYSTKIILLVAFYYFNKLNLGNLLLTFVIGYFISSLLGFVLIYKNYKTAKIKLEFNINLSLVKKIASRAIYLGLSSLSIMILAKIDTVMLSFYTNLENVGYFNIASEISKKASVFMTPIVMGAVPLFVSKNLDLKKTYGQVVKRIVLLGLLLCLILLFFSKTVISIVYGSAYQSSVLVLQIMSILPILTTLQTFNQQLLILKDKNKIILIYSVISATLNIILNYILIPKYSIYGSALATVISYFVWTLLCNYKLRKLRVF